LFGALRVPSAGRDVDRAPPVSLGCRLAEGSRSSCWLRSTQLPMSPTATPIPPATMNGIGIEDPAYRVDRAVSILNPSAGRTGVGNGPPRHPGNSCDRLWSVGAHRTRTPCTANPPASTPAPGIASPRPLPWPARRRRDGPTPPSSGGASGGRRPRSSRLPRRGRRLPCRQPAPPDEGAAHRHHGGEAQQQQVGPVVARHMGVEAAQAAQTPAAGPQGLSRSLLNFGSGRSPSLLRSRLCYAT